MKKSVLLIENDPSIAEIVDYILTDAGYLVVQSPPSNYFEAVKTLQPGVVLLDYSLSGDITGDAICAQIKASPDTAGIPVIIVSATTGLEAIARSCKADDVLSKPFDICDLEKVINKWVKITSVAN